MKVYKLIKPDDYKGLFKVSLVDDPAIQSNLMAFSEDKENFTFADDEKRVIYAPALIPNKLIFRKNINGSPANVYFDADTIRQIHIDGCRNNYDSKVNLNHQSEDTSGVFCIESWIIEDESQDKAFKMGFDVPVGTLMKGYKIDNDAVWNDIKSGNLKGLSIEAQLFPEEQVSKFKKEDMNKKNLIQLALDKLKEAFNFADMTDYGNGFYGSSLEKGAIITDKDGNAMVSATFEFDGNKYTTDEMGAIAEIEVIEVVEAEDEAATGGSDELEDAKAKITELETKIADLEAQLTEAESTKMANEEAEVKLKADHEEALKNITKLENEVIELKKIPAIPATNDEALTPLEKFRAKKKMY